MYISSVSLKGTLAFFMEEDFLSLPGLLLLNNGILKISHLIMLCNSAGGTFNWAIRFPTVIDFF